MKGFNYNKDTDILKFYCCICDNLIEFDCSEFFSEWSDHSNCGAFEYNNLMVNCDKCNSIHGFNMNISEFECGELDLEENGALTNDAINTRKYLRDIMWKHRDDLKDKDREQEENEHVYPEHIQKLIKRNNVIQTLMADVNVTRQLTDKQINMIKQVATGIVEGNISLLNAISEIKEFLNS